MALIKTVVLLVALLNGVLFLQALDADEVAAPTVTSHVTLESTNSSGVTISEDGYSYDHDVENEDSGTADLLPDHGDVFEEEEDGDLSDAFTRSTDVDEEGEGDEEEDDALSPAHPLARFLTSRSSKKCWSKKSCKKFYKKPGCCKKKCVNLASDGKNCGKCGKRCKRGSKCKSGKCVKPSPQCSRKKKCHVKGQTCCKGKCVNLGYNNGHCGKCSKSCNTKKGYSCKSAKCVKGVKPSAPAKECSDYKKCKSGKTCCKGTCKSLKYDNRNCGACGKSCGYAKKCCHGYCVNVFGSDKNHCGGCGKKCATTCTYGMCGYGQ